MKKYLIVWAIVLWLNFTLYLKTLMFNPETLTIPILFGVIASAVIFFLEKKNKSKTEN